MKIDFNDIAETILPHFKGGEGQYIMKHYTDQNVKIMLGRLQPGSSIGLHTHEQNSEIIYILTGVATFIYEGQEETLLPGQVHYNPMGKQHTLINRSQQDLTFFAVVPEHHRQTPPIGETTLCSPNIMDEASKKREQGARPVPE